MAIIFIAILFLGELFSQFDDRALVRDRQSKRILEFARANYDFSIDGGKQSLESGLWGEIVVDVKKGSFPVAGKKVVVSFSKPVLLKQDGEQIFVQSVERFTDELGRVTLNFLPKQVGNLEVLVFFLHPIQNFSEHLFRLNYFVYQKKQLLWSFFSPFVVLAVLGFLVLCNLFFASFFPKLTKSFFRFTYNKKSLKSLFVFIYGFVYRFIERQPSQMLFPLFWCRPHFLLKKDHSLKGDKKKLDWQTERQFLLKSEGKKSFVFFLCSFLWVILYLVMPSFALLGALVSFAFLKKPWAFSFLLFCFFNVLFAVFLSQPQPPVAEVYEMLEESSFFIIVVFFLFPSPALAVSFFLLSIDRFYPSWRDYFFSSGNTFPKIFSEIDFGLMSSFFTVIFVSFFSTTIIYFYCRNVIIRRGFSLKKNGGKESGEKEK